MMRTIERVPPLRWTASALRRLGLDGRGLVVGVPLIWLLVFFLIPFLVVAKISLSTAAIAMPPYVPLFEWDGEQLLITLNLGNFAYLLDDPLYINAYLSSLKIAFVSAVISLFVGYPIAYYIARSPEPRRSILLTLVILPFWTSFLLRVYAWQGFLRSNGVINNFLIWTGIIDTPLVMLQTNFAVYLGIVYTYLPFMILPLYANLVKLDESLLEASADLGGRPLATFFHVDPAALDAGGDRRLHAGLRPGDRRVRHPRAPRRPGHADDRAGALERVLLQSRLAGGERRGDRDAAGAGRADHDPAQRPDADGGELMRNTRAIPANRRTFQGTSFTRSLRSHDAVQKKRTGGAVPPGPQARAAAARPPGRPQCGPPARVPQPSSRAGAGSGSATLEVQVPASCRVRSGGGAARCAPPRSC